MRQTDEFAIVGGPATFEPRFTLHGCCNRDVAAFFAKWLDDIADAQHESGVSYIAPRLNIPWAGAGAWGDARVIIQWTVHEMYGSTAILHRHSPR